MLPRSLFFALALSVQPLLAGETSALHEYFDNTLIWQNRASGAIGRIWLNPDGRYYAFYNLGPQPKAPDVHGPFQIEGRSGTFTMRNMPAGSLLCLWPSSPRAELKAQQQRELYSEAMCYTFVLHSVGDVWDDSADPLHRAYRFWLVKGR
jgi:hypothetical protein